MSAPRTITRSAVVEATTALGLDPAVIKRLEIAPSELIAEVLTDRDDPMATIPYPGAEPRKTVRIPIEDGGES